MNTIVDRLWGYWVLCLMARRPVLLAPPKVTYLISLLEGGHDELEMYLDSLGFELVLDDDDVGQARSKKFDHIEAIGSDAQQSTSWPLPHIRKTRTNTKGH